MKISKIFIYIMKKWNIFISKFLFELMNNNWEWASWLYVAKCLKGKYGRFKVNNHLFNKNS